VPLVSTRALVLQSFPYSETSKILRLYTRDHGLRSVIAKGAQRPKSRFGGLLEPFTEGVALFYLKEGRDLHTLSGWDLVRSHQSLGRDLTAFTGASLVAELALHYGTEEPHEDLYQTLSAAFDALAAVEGEAKGRVALAAAWVVVGLLGFAPQTDACVECGRPFDAEEPTRFDVEGGGTACRECRRVGRVLDPLSRGELRQMLRGHAPGRPLADPSAHRALLRGYLNAQLARERPLRSLDLFLQQLC
jgi:DNA repair protein RecO (recombination protein O)